MKKEKDFNGSMQHDSSFRKVNTDYRRSVFFIHTYLYKECLLLAYALIKVMTRVANEVSNLENFHSSSKISRMRAASGFVNMMKVVLENSPKSR